MINLQIGKPYTDLVAPELLEQAVFETLTQSSTPVYVELTIVLESSEYVRALNKQYRQIDAPTDVLSFPGGDLQDPESGLTYLGDIVISVPKAQSQAAHGGHTLDAELQLLTVHGVLHLIGYNHAEEEQKAAMWQIQAKILDAIGADINTLPEDEHE